MKWKESMDDLAWQIVVDPVATMQIPPSGRRFCSPVNGIVPRGELTPESFPRDCSQQKGAPQSGSLSTPGAACMHWLIDLGSVQDAFASTGTSLKNHPSSRPFCEIDWNLCCNLLQVWLLLQEKFCLVQLSFLPYQLLLPWAYLNKLPASKCLFQTLFPGELHIRHRGS